MSSHPRFLRFRRALFGCGVVLFVGSALAVVAPTAPPAAAAPESGLAVSVSAVTDVGDGQALDLRVTAPEGRTLSPIGGAARVCRDGVTYASEADLQFAAGNCPEVSISSSGSVANHAGLHVMPDLTAAVGTYRVGVGAVEWSRGPTRFDLTCDSELPCRLVVLVRLDNGEAVVDGSTLLTFSDAAPLASCGGAHPDAIDTAGPDRFVDTWARWTRDQCETTKQQAWTNAVFAGEGLGLDQFASGDVDLVYSATGPTMPGRRRPAERAAISVPLGVNAAVFALVGGYADQGATDWPIGLRRPFSQVQVTAAELASLVGQGVHGFVGSGASDAVVARSPQVANVNGLTGPVQAPASSDATTYVTTRWFDSRAGDAWLTSPIQDPPSRPREVVDELSAATPPFATWAVSMYSSRATLKKVVADDATRPLDYNLTWVLTDLATAEQLGLPVAALQNSRGEFVTPTADSLAKAAATFTRQADGTFLAGTGADPAGAYPLTFVEHAVVPAKPDCASASFAVLRRWVGYLTGDGQQHLVGVEPLAGEIRTGAERSVAALDAACDGTSDGEPGPTEAPPSPGADPGDLGGGALPGDLGSSFGGIPSSGDGFNSGSGLDAGSDAAERAARDAEGRDEVAEAASRPLPPLLGRPVGRATAGLASLVGLAFMGAGAGSLGGGRRRSFGAVAP